MNTNTLFISTVSSGFCLFCIVPKAGYQWNMLPAPSFFSCFTSETTTEKRGNPLREASRPKQSLVGADCHVPKVTSWPNSTSHSFLGGGARRRAGEPLYSADQHGAMQTLCSFSLIPQPSSPQPHLLNWSTLHIYSAGFSHKQHSPKVHLFAKMHVIYLNLELILIDYKSFGCFLLGQGYIQPVIIFWFQIIKKRKSILGVK